MTEESLFHEALAKPPNERAAFLAAACAEQPALRATVEALLAAHEASGNLLDRPPADVAQTLDSRPNLAPPGVTVDQPPPIAPATVIAGRYKLVEEIGEGGMGTVFMAQQAAPVKRLVAVKIIKPGMDSREVLARFEAERQALALMDHPNIARVLDAGSTDSGRPFFLMELVKGTPITQYCDQCKLTPRERLELFLPVCQAIQHAHQKGVIHRDIKPSNVLVALYDDHPVPKVIDFGLAKATGQSLTDKTLITGFGALVGTPEYMSPEQANLNNLDIDTRCDIYSLGVLLYELLTGSTPVDRKSLADAAVLEVLRIVREVEAPRPSAKLSSSANLPSIAANRGTDPARLTKLLRGELDWVLLKSLEKDRGRRYETANGLARDIERYLADEVVEARPPSTGYRLRKFVRRNKGQVIAGSLVLLALLAGIAGTTFGLIRAEQQRSRAVAGEKLAGQRLVQVEAEKKNAVAAAERERLAKIDADAKRREAETNLAFATKASEILGSVFAGLDPMANYATVAELRGALTGNLNKAVKALDGAAIGNPLIVARMQRTLGQSLLALRETNMAIVVLEKSAATCKAKLGPDDPDTLVSIDSLALAYQDAGKLDLALPLFEETLKLRKAKLGRDHPDTLHSMIHLAEAYQGAGKLDLALPLLEEAIGFMKNKPRPDKADMFAIKIDLARAYMEAGAPKLALPLLEEALKFQKATLGPDNPNTLTTMNGLAAAYMGAGKLDLALPLIEETLKLQKATLGPDHPNTLATMNNLAAAYKEAGKLELAVPLLEETLKLTKAKRGPDHPDTLIKMNNLAAVYYAAGKVDLALPLFEEALKLQEATRGLDHPNTRVAMNNLVGAYQNAGKLDQAVPLLQESLRLRKAKLGPDHRDTFVCMDYLAKAYQAAGKLDLALPLMEETLKLGKAKFGPDDPVTIGMMNNLAGAYQTAGKLELALPLMEQTVKLGKAKFGPDDPITLGMMNNLFNFRIEAGDKAKAAELLPELLADARRQLPGDSPKMARQLATIGAALLNAKAFAEAEPILRECLAIREKTRPGNWMNFNTRSKLGGALLGQKKYVEAEPLLLAGYDGMKQRAAKIPPTSKVRLTEAVERLVQLYEDLGKKDEAAKWRKELKSRKDAAARDETGALRAESRRRLDAVRKQKPGTE